MTRCYVITGASSGIGYALTQQLYAHGHTIIATGRTQKECDQLKEQFPNVHAVPLDLCSSASIEHACTVIKNQCTHIDALINNAGVALGKPVELLTREDLENLFSVNVIGHVELTQHLLPLLRSATQPRIIFNGSAAGYFVRPLLGGYAASKFALEAIVDALRMELYHENIKVSLIEPGRIKTPIWSVPPKEEWEDSERARPYQNAITILKKEVQVNATESPSVEIVLRAFMHALRARNPRHRYKVGFDATLARILNWLPRSLLDRLLLWLMW